MTAKPDRHSDRDTAADIDAVAWVRRRRDAMYEDTCNLPAEELIRFVRNAAATAEAAAGIVPSIPAERTS